MNLPNSITLTRIASIPVFMWVLTSHWFRSGVHGERELLASGVFILASLTDVVDGYLARKRGQEISPALAAKETPSSAWISP